MREKRRLTVKKRGNKMKLLKKMFCLLLALTLGASCAFAEGGINVTKKDINLNKTLDKNVTNILVLLQDGGVTDTIMIASINSRTGRSVMTRVNSSLMADIPEAGETRLADVYELGSKKCRGLLAERTINTMLALNIGTYLALDISTLPTLVDAVDTVSMELTAEEAAALGLEEGWNDLEGEELLAFVRLHLDGDDPARSRGYDALMQLLYAGVHSGDLGSMMGLGKSLLSSMDTNLNVMTAITLASAVQNGDDRRELVLPEPEQVISENPLRADEAAMQKRIQEEIYE